MRVTNKSGTTVLWIAIATLAAAAAADRRAAEDGLFGAYRTEPELSSFLYRAPRGCVRVGDGVRICTWVLGNRDESWLRIRELVPTRDRVSVVCELPADLSPRAPDTCSVHPRRSRSAGWTKPRKHGVRSHGVDYDRALRELNARASAVLARRRTALELSRLAGEGPDRCSGEDGDLTCLWRLTRSSEGYDAISSVIGSRKKVRLECRLPADGSPRTPGSCAVTVGG